MGKFHDESKKEPKKVNQVETWRKHHVLQCNGFKFSVIIVQYFKNIFFLNVLFSVAEGVQLEQKMIMLASAIIVVYNLFFLFDDFIITYYIIPSVLFQYGSNFMKHDTDDK